MIRLSVASYRKMVQNLAWAAGYNVVAIPLAAGAFAWAGITLGPEVGAVLMSLSTIVVALNGSCCDGSTCESISPRQRRSGRSPLPHDTPPAHHRRRG